MSHSLAARLGGFFKFGFGKKSIEGKGRARGSVAEGIEKTKGALKHVLTVNLDFRYDSCSIVLY